VVAIATAAVVRIVVVRLVVERIDSSEVSRWCTSRS
jgi:hypothetical protein